MFLCFEVVDVSPSPRSLDRARSSGMMLKKAGMSSKKLLERMKAGAEEIGQRVGAWTSQHFRSKSAAASSSTPSLDSAGASRATLLPAGDTLRRHRRRTTATMLTALMLMGRLLPEIRSGSGHQNPPDMVRGRKALRRPHTTNDKMLSRASRRPTKSLDVPKLRLTPVDENMTSKVPEGSTTAAAPERIPIGHLKSTDTWGDVPSESEVSAAEEEAHPEDKDKSEEVMVIFREKWAEKEKRIRSQSPYGSCEGWRLIPVIVKSNDDLRQEQFAYQLILQFQRIFKKAHGNLLWLRPYSILATSSTAGLIEAVPDTISLDALKKKSPNYVSLNAFLRDITAGESTAQSQAAVLQVSGSVLRRLLLAADKG